MLIRCTECNTVFPDSKAVCPNCGKEAVVESNNESTTTERGNNWWINWGSLIIVTTAIFLLLIAVTLLIIGIYLICDSNIVNRKADIGIPLTIIGGVCFILCIISFAVSRHCESKYGLKKPKPNKASQEEYEALIREYINSGK